MCKRFDLNVPKEYRRSCAVCAIQDGDRKNGESERIFLLHCARCEKVYYCSANVKIAIGKSNKEKFVTLNKTKTTKDNKYRQKKKKVTELDVGPTPY
eukprot:TRINITY_DN4464_c0_g1_i1.p1 TRINITY_DN4464_c0_g1~~TRINITY_DN4464_c0_g1_i1.p1  ORF type:complete len:97 (+),score=9.40 TRINITY_DN4464_c0_g1_i1:206-496(+)